MVIVMLGAETKAGVMDRVCIAEMSLFPLSVPTDIQGQARGLREDRAKSWKEAG